MGWGLGLWVVVSGIISRIAIAMINLGGLMTLTDNDYP